MLALLAAIAQPATAVLHGVAHEEDAAHAVAVAVIPAVSVTVGAPTPSASLAPAVHAPDDDPADHPVLHAQTVATAAWSLSPGIPVVVTEPLVLATVVRTTAASRAPPAYPLAPHALLPNQPRAPPLG